MKTFVTNLLNLVFLLALCGLGYLAVVEIQPQMQSIVRWTTTWTDATYIAVVAATLVHFVVAISILQSLKCLDVKSLFIGVSAAGVSLPLGLLLFVMRMSDPSPVHGATQMLCGMYGLAFGGGCALIGLVGLALELSSAAVDSLWRVIDDMALTLRIAKERKRSQKDTVHWLYHD